MQVEDWYELMGLTESSPTRWDDALSVQVDDAVRRCLNIGGAEWEDHVIQVLDRHLPVDLAFVPALRLQDHAALLRRRLDDLPAAYDSPSHRSTYGRIRRSLRRLVE